MTDLLTVNEFAARLTITPACVRRWILEQKISVVHIGRLVRVPATEVNRVIEAGFRAAKGVQRGDAR
jgi:excisionase family DNA binding protein